MKLQIKDYAFDASARTITINDVDTVELQRVLLITNVTRNIIIFNSEMGIGATLLGNTLTLSHDTSSYSDSDELRIVYEYGDKAIIGNIRERFREGFGSKDTSIWTFSEAASDQVFVDGNVAGAGYINISKSAITPVSETSVTSVKTFEPPAKIISGISLSQRILGQDFAIEWCGTDENNNIPADPAFSPVAVSGTIDANTTTWVINTSTPHGLLPGDWVVFYDNADSRANLGPVVVQSIASTTQFRVSGTDHDANLTCGGSVIKVSPVGGALTVIGTRFYGTSASNADATIRNGDAAPRAVNWNPGNSQTDAVIPSEGGINYASVNFTRSFRPRGLFVMNHALNSVVHQTTDIESTAVPRSTSKRELNVPEMDKHYKIRFRAVNYPNLSRPVGSITAVSKSASTTATITVPSHGLNVNDYVVVYGIRDQTNFANLTTATKVASVIDGNNITIAFGASATATSYGGFVVRVNGSSVASIENRAIQTYAKTADGLRLSVVAGTNWAEVIGNTVTLYGLVNSSNVAQTALHGRYRVAMQSTTTMELEPLDGQDISVVSTTPANAGGTVIRNTDFRLHMNKVYEYSRVLIESLMNSTDGANSMPVSNAGTFSVVASGIAAHDAAISGNPNRIAGRALTANYTGVATGDTADLVTTIVGALVNRPYSIPEADYSFSAPTGGILNTTTPLQVKEAAAAGIRNYVTGLKIYTDALGTATELRLRQPDLTCSSQTIASNTLTTSAAHGLAIGDQVVFTASTVTGITTNTTYYVLTVPATTTLTLSATRVGSTLVISGTGVTATLHRVLFNTKIPTSGSPFTELNFAIPLKGSAATALQIQTVTATTTGAVFVNGEGYTAP